MAHLLLAASTLWACQGQAAPLIAAHRGSMASGHPENTLPAFLHAAGMGAHFIELDLRTTADGALVVMHDRRVDRTTDGHGAVADLSLAGIQRLDAGGGARVPTLDEVLAATRPLAVQLLLDIKPAPGLDPAEIVAAVAARRRLDQVVFGVRSLEVRSRLARASPDLRFLALLRRPEHIDGFLAAGVEGVRLWPQWIHDDRGLVRRLRDAGTQVWVTTGDAPVAELLELAADGVDVLLTDRPAAAVAALHCD